MKRKILFKLFALLACLLCSVSAVAQEAYACYLPSLKRLTFYYDNQRSFRIGTTYDLNTGDDQPGWYSDGSYADVTKVVFDESFAGARPTSTYAWFFSMTNLTEINGIANLDTRDVTTMRSMFNSCTNLTQIDMSHFNTENVTSMAKMFASCSSLTALDVSSLNTEKVTDMNGMFSGCSGLTTLDVSNFNTSKVTDMNHMFDRCGNLTSLDLKNFNTEKVTDMSFMFYYLFNLTNLDVSSFNTENVTDMTYMFACNSANSNSNCLTVLDLSSFNTAKVTSIDRMFLYRGNLETIYVSDQWSTESISNSIYMFYGCTNLVGGQGTTYDAGHTDAAYAHIDGGASNPGYFTDKNASLRGDVNGDNMVNIADVTALTDLLLGGGTAGPGADCNIDGSVNIADVTALIDYILKGTW